MARHKAKDRQRDQKKLINLENVRTERKQKHAQLIPRNTKQEEYLKHLENTDNKIVISAGSAGTGKTLFAVTKAIQELQSKNISRLIITRPAVGVEGENHGFLPGDINQKMEPWLLPILDVLWEHYSKKDVTEMIERGVIEIAPMMYMRGRSFRDAFIILDEAQNSTPEQMCMILTRLGENCRIVVTGDLDQTDHRKMNGLDDLTKRVAGGVDGIAMCVFSAKHVERSKIVQTVVNLYK